MSAPTADDQLVQRVRRTYVAVADATRVGVPNVRAIPMTADVGTEPVSRKQSARRRALLAVAAVLVSAGVLVGVLAVRDGTIGSSEPKVRTPAGPDAVVPDSALSISDDVVLDLVAPVSYLSRRNSAALELAIARQRYEHTAACIHDEIGFELPGFEPDGTRFFDFPDPDELRAEGVHDPSEADGEPSFTPPEGFDDAVAGCHRQLTQASAYDSLQNSLTEAWGPTVVAARERSDEQTNWQLAVECLAGRGYPVEELASEVSLAGIGDSIGLYVNLNDEERSAVEAKLTEDYVDCVEPVWTARAAYLLEQRDGWATAHAAELDALAAQLRASFGAEG